MTWKHGTLGGYDRHRCRCQKCRENWNAYQAVRRKKRRAEGICRNCTNTLDPEGSIVFCPECRMRATENAAVLKLCYSQRQRKGDNG